MATRRRLLQGAAGGALAALALAGCDRAGRQTTTDSPPAPEPTTTDPSLAAELAVLAAYDAYLAGPSARQRRRIGQLRDQHADHVVALGGQIPALPEPGTADEGAGKWGLARLTALQRRVASQHRQAAAADGDSDRAALLCVIAASEAQHVAVLEGL